MSRAPMLTAAEREHTTLDRLVHAQITASVDLATHYYATGHPGRGAYELARLAMRVNRLLDHQQTQGETA